MIIDSSSWALIVELQKLKQESSWEPESLYIEVDVPCYYPKSVNNDEIFYNEKRVYEMIDL